MDLLKVGSRYINLLRISAIEERIEGASRVARLILGDVTIDLDPDMSARFFDFVASNYRVRDLDNPSGSPVVGKGQIVRSEVGGGLKDRPGA